MLNIAKLSGIILSAAGSAAVPTLADEIIRTPVEHKTQEGSISLPSSLQKLDINWGKIWLSNSEPQKKIVHEVVGSDGILDYQVAEYVAKHIRAIPSNTTTISFLVLSPDIPENQVALGAGQLSAVLGKQVRVINSSFLPSIGANPKEGGGRLPITYGEALKREISDILLNTQGSEIEIHAHADGVSLVLETLLALRTQLEFKDLNDQEWQQLLVDRLGVITYGSETPGWAPAHHSSSFKSYLQNLPDFVGQNLFHNFPDPKEASRELITQLLAHEISIDVFEAVLRSFDLRNLAWISVEGVEAIQTLSRSLLHDISIATEAGYAPPSEIVRLLATNLQFSREEILDAQKNQREMELKRSEMNKSSPDVTVDELSLTKSQGREEKQTITSALTAQILLDGIRERDTKVRELLRDWVISDRLSQEKSEASIARRISQSRIDTATHEDLGRREMDSLSRERALASNILDTQMHNMSVPSYTQQQFDSLSLAERESLDVLLGQVQDVGTRNENHRARKRQEREAVQMFYMEMAEKICMAMYGGGG